MILRQKPRTLRYAGACNLGSPPDPLQARKRGIEANVEVWFVISEPRFALMPLGCKRIGDGDRGEMTGCSLDFVSPISLHAKAVRETVGKLFPACSFPRIYGCVIRALAMRT
jgi:hypothetical protein